MKKILLTLTFFALIFILNAQDSTMNNGSEEMTGMRSNDKIYVVVAVIGTILAGFFIYLIRLDRKIERMERKKE